MIRCLDAWRIGNARATNGDAAHATGVSGGNPSGRIFDHEAVAWCDAKAGSGGKEDIRCGLAMRDAFSRDGRVEVWGEPEQCHDGADILFGCGGTKRLTIAGGMQRRHQFARSG